MLPYYDIHTHRQSKDGGTLSVRSLHEQFEQAEFNAMCSVGLHPWFLENSATAFAQLKTIAALPQVIAIGECGLDRLCQTDWQLQCDVFELQIELAGKLQKPLVVHCVRAYDEAIAMLTRSKVSVPVIFHGYNKKEDIAEKLLSHGYNLSFGAAILQDNAPAAQMLCRIAGDSFFLETDDSEIAISDLYKRAADIRKTTEDAIILQVAHNFKKVFNR